MKNWIFLIVAIISEVIATSALKESDGFSKLWPSLIVIVGYSLAFYLLSLTLRTIPIGIAYAIWAGLGMALIAIVGWFVFKQPLDTPAIIGIGLIVVGLITLFSYKKRK